MEVLYAQVHRDPLPPSARNSALNAQVDAVIMRGLAKDPAARWETSTAFVDALADALAGKPAPAAAKTVVMASPIASTVPLAGPIAAGAAVAVAPPVARAEAVNRGATVAMAYPAPAAQPVADKRSHKRLYALIAVVAIVLLLISSVVLIAALRTPSLSLSSSTVVAGDPVVVSATNVPADQNGEIELRSTLHIFSFHADSNGRVSVPIVVPRTIGAGDHTVTICWASRCRNSVTLHVIESGVALASPTSGTTPGVTPSASPTPNTTPGASPAPTGGTSRSPQPSPISTPKSTPPPPPLSSPTPNPCPTSSQSALLAVSPATIVAGVTVVTVSGQNFTPYKQGVVYYYFPNTATTPTKTWSVTVGCNGTFSVSFTPAALNIGTARVTAGDAGGRSASKNFSIT